MPELPDIDVYIDCLNPRTLRQPLERVRLFNPFLLRTFEPPIDSFFGKSVREITRLGKRIVFHFENECFLILHLMIAGRLHWKAHGAKPPGKIGLAAFDFPTGTLTLTEAGSKRRASLHAACGLAALKAHDPGGLEVLAATPAQFIAALKRENRTIKRALTDPRILSGIGNSYSDEILHRAGMSPLILTSKLSDNDCTWLLNVIVKVLTEWRERLRQETGDDFPEGVTAFRPGMAVHGRFGKPCPVCQSPIQRIRYADNETNYCPKCQTGGKVLADRSLSRLLKDDWPRTLEELESHS